VCKHRAASLAQRPAHVSGTVRAQSPGGAPGARAGMVERRAGTASGCMVWAHQLNIRMRLLGAGASILDATAVAVMLGIWMPSAAEVMMSNSVARLQSCCWSDVEHLLSISDAIAALGTCVAPCCSSGAGHLGCHCAAVVLGVEPLTSLELGELGSRTAYLVGRAGASIELGPSIELAALVRGVELAR